MNPIGREIPHESAAGHVTGSALYTDDLLARFPNALHVPLRTVPMKASELPRDKLLVLACQKGVRSMRALEMLREMGFTRLKNLHGGIDAWSLEVDNSVPRY